MAPKGVRDKGLLSDPPSPFGRSWAIGATALLIAVVLVSGSAAAASGEGEYTASQRWPLDCPLSTKAPDADTASFSGNYTADDGHGHRNLEVVVVDNVVLKPEVLVCTYHENGDYYAGTRNSGTATISTGEVHYTFLAWVEPVYVETSEGTLTFASAGEYSWVAWD